MEVIANKKYMIGDRVIADGEKSVILELRRTCAQVEPSFDLVEYGDIQPIPLTAEILQKNGFSIKEGGYIMTLAIEDTFTMNIDDEQGQHKWAIIITDAPWCVKIKVFGMLAISIVIHFVHELQHALRLVGLNEVADNLNV